MTDPGTEPIEAGQRWRERIDSRAFTVVGPLVNRVGWAIQWDDWREGCSTR